MSYRKFTCQVCADSGIAPGTRWEDIPADWACPQCGATKADFTVVACALS